MSFTDRGGRWVLAQTGLMSAAVALGPLWPGAWAGPVAGCAGWILSTVGAIIGIAGAVTLGRARTIFPRPLPQAMLVRRGIYGRVRHPLYTSVSLLALGWGLAWGSWPALLVAALLGVFFDAKARHEERWLRERFPDYADYQRRVRRFLPGIY